MINVMQCVYITTCGRIMFGLFHYVCEPLFDRDEGGSRLKPPRKKVAFNLSGDEDSEGEAVEDIFGGKSQNSEKSESKSSFEKRQDKVTRFKLYINSF